MSVMNNLQGSPRSRRANADQSCSSQPPQKMPVFKKRQRKMVYNILMMCTLIVITMVKIWA